jgi:sugar phosphate isomerase/epimerase
MSQARDRVGVMLNNLERDRLRAFAVARSHGFTVVHANALPESMLEGTGRAAYVRAARESGLTIATMFIGFDGQDYSSRRSIAATVGLVQPELRPHRLVVARRYSDLAAELGVPSLGMHLGLLPQGGDHGAIVDCLHELLDVCAAHGQTLNLETGQESAYALFQVIMQVNRPKHLLVNFDPANFVLYGTDRPLAALDILYPMVRGVHCKDAVSSETPCELGRETPLGQGEVNTPAILRFLQRRGYGGPLIIEREHGPNVVDEIIEARAYLECLLTECV